MDTYTPKAFAAALDITYRKALKIVSGGGITATKENQRWKIKREDFENFKTSNEIKIADLREKYILMYRQGHKIKKLKRCTKEDFDKASY